MHTQEEGLICGCDSSRCIAEVVLVELCIEPVCWVLNLAGNDRLKYSLSKSHHIDRPVLQLNCGEIITGIDVIHIVIIFISAEANKDSCALQLGKNHEFILFDR